MTGRYRLTVAIPDGPAVIYTGSVDDAISRAQRELIERTRGNYTATEYLALSTLARATGEPLYVAGMAWTLTVDPSPRSASCPRCGQTMIADDSTVCGPCRQLDRAPQGEQDALFNLPAAAPVNQEGALF